MKRNLLILTTLLLGLIYFACRKNETIILPKFQDSFVASAVDYLKLQISNQDFQSLDFKSVQLLKTDGVTTGVIIRSKNKSELRSIIIGKKGNVFKGNWLYIEHNGSKNNGILHTQSFDETSKSDVFFVNNKAVKVVKTKKGITKTTIIKFRRKNQLEGTTITQRQMDSGVESTEYDGTDYDWMPDICVLADVDNNSYDFYSLFWEFDSDPDYLYLYSTDPNEYPEGGGETLNVEPYVTTSFDFQSGDGINLVNLFNCFTKIANQGATYSVSISAFLPDKTDPNKMVNGGGHPGHTFITLTKTNGASTLSQSFGFYPQNGVLSMSMMAVSSKMVNDGSHEFNASITMNNISSLDFNTVEHMAENLASSMQYDLNDFNCTNYGVEVFNSIRPNNPIVVPDWSGMYGSVNFHSTPNGLYQLIKSMNGANGSKTGDYYAPAGSTGCN